MLLNHRRHRPTGGPALRRGQGLVEFALVAPILLLMFFAVVQFGMILWAQNALTQVVRDTGRSSNGCNV